MAGLKKAFKYLSKKLVTSKSGKKYWKYLYKKGTGSSGNFSATAIKNQLGRRTNTSANRRKAVDELKKLVAYDKAKTIRRAKERAATPEAYLKRKVLRKKAEMRLMKKQATLREISARRGW